MAENAAHLSTAPQSNPNIFEVVAQESLMSILQPALKTLIDLLSSRNPDKYNWLIKWNEELYLVINFFLQYHYVKNCDASFSEAFYGLQRVALNDNSKEKLPTKRKIMSIICLVFFPYFRTKLLTLANRYENERFTTTRSSFKRSVVQLNRWINALYECYTLYQYIAYMTGKSPSQSPLLRMAGVYLTYQNEDVSAVANLSWKEMIISLFSSARRPSSYTFPLFVRAFTHSLEFGAFFIQFLKWWHSDEMKTRFDFNPIPPPPKNSQGLPKDDLCPICRKKRKIEVALSTSGYVFCYKCIKEVLDAEGRCPVTNLPATTNELVRVYRGK